MFSEKRFFKTTRTENVAHGLSTFYALVMPLALHLTDVTGSEIGLLRRRHFTDARMLFLSGIYDKQKKKLF